MRILIFRYALAVISKLKYFLTVKNLLNFDNRHRTLRQPLGYLGGMIIYCIDENKMFLDYGG